MDKKQLIGFILNDIKELELIAKGMHEMDKIPEVMQQLAISKTQSVLDRFCHLRESPQKEETSPNNLLAIEGFTFEKPEPPQQEKPTAPKAEELLLQKGVSQVLNVLKDQDLKEVPQNDEVISEPTKEEPKETAPPSEEKKGTIIAEEKIKVQERTTNEKFKSRIPPVKAVAPSKRAESRFIQDLRKAININDRYRYQRELFGGNAELMNSVIDKLDAMNSLAEAITYVEKEFVWNAESETVVDFYSLLDSRFS